ncbi:MAG TPA: glycosyltransferase family 39 protein [Candidatus Limnocylindria bacterium]
MTFESPARSPRLERGLLVAIALAFMATAAVLVVFAPQFTWDESVYALTTRHWLEGTPASGWGPHRPLVLSALGTLPVGLGFTDEAAFRVLSLLFAGGLIFAAWYLARGIAGPVAGLGAALAVAAVPTFANDAGLFLTDIPSTALLLAMAAVLWRSMERAGAPDRHLLWVAPLAAATFYLRYGSILALLALAVAAGLIWPAKLAQGWRLVLATLALTAALLVPHAVEAIVLTGSPIGIALAAQTGAQPAHLGDGLLFYLAALPSGGLTGFVPGALMLAALIALGTRLATRHPISVDPITRAMAFLVLSATLQLVVTGLFILPQIRYVFPAIALLVVAGAIGSWYWLNAAGRGGRAVLAATAVALLVSVAGNAFVVRGTAMRVLAAYEWQRDVGQLIRRMAGPNCSVLATDVPQITWYSGCVAVNFGDRAREGDRDRLLPVGERLLVLRTDGIFQPTGDVLAGYLARVQAEPIAVVRHPDGSIAARVYRFR